jgi:hypothetical protein
MFTLHCSLSVWKCYTLNLKSSHILKPWSKPVGSGGTFKRCSLPRGS